MRPRQLPAPYNTRHCPGSAPDSALPVFIWASELGGRTVGAEVVVVGHAASHHRVLLPLRRALGAAVNALPGGEIVAAMDRGLLDAAEFNNASSDRTLGFPDVSKVCMLQSYHQNAEQFEILFNKTKYDALPDKLKAIIAYATEAASADMSWKATDRYSQDYVELQVTDKVRFYKTPDAILQKQLELYDEIVAKKAAENPLFKEIVQSQLAFARRAARWEQDTVVSRRMAFDHYFGPNAKPVKI